MQRIEDYKGETAIEQLVSMITDQAIAIEELQKKVTMLEVIANKSLPEGIAYCLQNQACPHGGNPYRCTDCR